jgi:hypothetical protein
MQKRIRITVELVTRITVERENPGKLRTMKLLLLICWSFVMTTIKPIRNPIRIT